MIYLIETTIDERELKQSIEDDRAGAIAAFEGRVRNHNDEKAVVELIYETCESLAEKEADRIVSEAKEKFPILNAVLRHRTGKIKIGELAVFVAVSSAHRQAAFQACRYIIDEAKRRLAIWKKETYADGTSVWVNCQSCSAMRLGGAAHHEQEHNHHKHLKPSEQSAPVLSSIGEVAHE